MLVKKLTLTNFRSYEKNEFEFGRKMVIVGDNGAGKTNILEAIYLMATGKSYRADREEEMIRYQQQVASAQCSLLRQGFVGQAVHSTQDTIDLKITLTDGQVAVFRKKFEVNGVPRRMMDFVGKFRAVWFGPEDIDIITGSPTKRRKYLDFVLLQTDREYRRCLVSYEKGVRQRNRVLENIREGMATRNQLYFWDRLLIKDGEYVTRAREKYITLVNTSLPPAGVPSPNLGEGRTKYQIVYDKSVISEARLAQYEMEEVAAAATLVGPHRDDFQIQYSEKDYRDVAKYGSRGEQRMAVLWLKMGERDFLTNNQNEMPVLLLDDIFSELDHKHRDEVMKLVDSQVKNGGQVIMTTADPPSFAKATEGQAHDGWNVINLK